MFLKSPIHWPPAWQRLSVSISTNPLIFLKLTSAVITWQMSCVKFTISSFNMQQQRKLENFIKQKQSQQRNDISKRKIICYSNPTMLLIWPISSFKHSRKSVVRCPPPISAVFCSSRKGKKICWFHYFIQSKFDFLTVRPKKNLGIKKIILMLHT